MGFCRRNFGQQRRCAAKLHRHDNANELTASTSSVRWALHYWLTTHPRFSPHCCGSWGFYGIASSAHAQVQGIQEARAALRLKHLVEWPTRGVCAGWGREGERRKEGERGGRACTTIWVGALRTPTPPLLSCTLTQSTDTPVLLRPPSFTSHPTRANSAPSARSLPASIRTLQQCAATDNQKAFIFKSLNCNILKNAQ